MFCVLYDWVLNSGTVEIFLIYHVSISCDHHEYISAGTDGYLLWSKNEWSVNLNTELQLECVVIYLHASC